MRRAALAVAGLLVAALAHAAAPVVAWDFTTGASGWQDEAGSKPATTAGGTAWPGTSAGLSLRSPDLILPTEAFQLIELCAIAEGPETAVQLLWLGQPFGRAEASWQGYLPVAIPADGKVHQLRLLPYWQNVPVVTALRLLAAPGARLRLVSLRVTGSGVAADDRSAWDFGDRRVSGLWLPLTGEALLRATTGGLGITLNQSMVTVASPPLALPAFGYEWLSADVTSTDMKQVALSWATSGARGLNGETFEVATGRHTLNVRAGAGRSWAGEVRGLAMTFEGPLGAEATVHRLTLATEPTGPPDPQPTYLGPLEPEPRAGRPFHLVLALENAGGAPAADVQVALDPGRATVIEAPAAGTIGRMDFGVPERFTWRLQAPAEVSVTITTTWTGGQRRNTVAIPLTAAPEASAMPTPPAAGAPVLAAAYHPPPPPLPGPAGLSRLLYHRPYLGDYAVTPEVVDWQARWSLAHGITCWVLDLGLPGQEQVERQVLDAILASPQARGLQVCFRWRSPAPSEASARSLLGGELAPILAQPRYLRLGGKPVVIIGSPVIPAGSGVALADLSGLAGDFALVATAPLGAVTAELLTRAGYVAVTGLDDSLGVGATTVLNDWDAAAKARLPHVQSLTPEWAGGMAPQRLRSLVAVARLRAANGKAGALPLVILGDWAAMEPQRPVGFALLDAVREAAEIAADRHVLPEDVGRGPYDRPPAAAPTRWEFDTRDSWTSAMGLNVLRVAGGQLTARTDTARPALFGGDTVADTRRYKAVVIGLATTAGHQGRLWWRTSLRRFVLENSLPFDLIADGAMHEYRLPVGTAAGWRGLLEGLRLDPTDVAGASIAVDYVRLEP